jgi:hypothetical protein
MTIGACRHLQSVDDPCSFHFRSYVLSVELILHQAVKRHGIGIIQIQAKFARDLAGILLRSDDGPS